MNDCGRPSTRCRRCQPAQHSNTGTTTKSRKISSSQSWMMTMMPKRLLLQQRSRLCNAGSFFFHGSPSTSIRRRHDLIRPTTIPFRCATTASSHCTEDRNARSVLRRRAFSSVNSNAQRPKRFYQNVHVVPVEHDQVVESFRKKKEDDSNDTPHLLLPRTPSPHLIPINKDDDDSSTSHNDRIAWHTVVLDNKPLRTPSGRPLYIPSLHLAWGMATEWNAVTDQIIPQQMPLMTLTCTVLDQVLAPSASPDSFRQQCLQYMATDTICYYADPKEERPLYQQQRKAWKRMHEWIATRFMANSDIAPPAIHMCQSNTSIYPQSTTTAALHLLEQPAMDRDDPPDDAPPPDTAPAAPLVRVLPHSPALTTAVQHWIATLDAWHLVALYVACKETKSFWLGVAMLMGHSAALEDPSPGADTAWVQTAARVEEEWNIRDWGFVEGQHDYDRLNCAVQLRAVALMVQCLNHR